ncbi:MAG: GNAT family N-acetyltransferase [Saprospiraceae bacterium]
MTFQCLPFAQLSVFQLYECMALRQEVFVVEQNCVYQDCDGKDLKGWHLMGYNTDGKLVAYARLLPQGTSYPDYPSIGRIVTSPSARGDGAGRALVQAAITEMHQLFGKVPIKIGAQLYLLKFYQSFGFQPVGEEYLEDGIPHIEMILPA